MIGPGIEVDDSGLSTWVNDAYMFMVDEISKESPDFFTKSATADTVSGQQEYELPSDFEKILMVNIQLSGTWVRAFPMPNINFIGVHENTASNQGWTTAAPGFYLIGNNIGFMPIPAESTDENIKIWYTYTPTELSEDSDEPAIPSKFHHIIKYGAYANYLDQDDEHVAAEAMRRRFEDRVGKMVESVTDRQLDQPKSVEITGDKDIYYTDYDY